MVFKTRLSKRTCFFIGKCFRSVLKLHKACISTKKSDTFVSLIFLTSRNTTFDTTSYPSLFFCTPIKQMKSHPHLFNSSIFNIPSFFYCYTKYNGQVFSF